jgi:hypothetical protein
MRRNENHDLNKSLQKARSVNVTSTLRSIRINPKKSPHFVKLKILTCSLAERVVEHPEHEKSLSGDGPIGIYPKESPDFVQLKILACSLVERIE